ncbi:type II toxin-antitoxin system Phd/YefM family antitoxin [Streptomyces sp. NBC_01498]|uniref:hypothetical protein n=1 Tax=Streptomyces sp. NBC_01498 TaxID=2975870 RepID=UPI002E7BCF61|nr:hypothetical protein [Streptomyces sp. NBC_01498]WTL24050.1 type II toxin-antitoxin system Phd/YefM family antitoxin [Streptomyces sp. NBC_01498]
MATGKGIEIAEDGVATVGMTEARALLTALIRDVRYGGQVGAFTERGARRAYLVTPDFYEQALADRRALEELQGDAKPKRRIVRRKKPTTESD